MYRGWIVADDNEDRQFLESLGITILSYDRKEGTYQVEMSDESLDKLDPFWHRFYWGLNYV